MTVYLEITNICNRSCPFCPGTKREKCFVSPKVIRKRLASIRRADELCLHLLGEPLLHPDFREIAEACRERGIPVTLTTNGTLLTEKTKAVLLENTIFRQINFSLQALEKDETAILDNILSFCASAMEKRPELYLNLRMWNLNMDRSMPDKDRLFLEKILQKFPASLPEDPHTRNTRVSVRLAGRLYLHTAPLFQWPVRSSGKTDGPVSCHGLRGQYGILADGTVVPCCLDSDGIIALGNMDETPLDEILHSPRAEAIRKGFRNGTSAEDLCRKCTFRETLDANMKYEI